MQQFFRRAAWRNLSLPIKTGLLFLLQVTLIGVMALSALAGQAVIRRQLQTSLATAIEMRSLAQELQANVEALERIEARLVEQRYGWQSFELMAPRFRADYAELVEGSQAAAERLEELSGLVMTDEDSVQVRAELRTITSALRSGATGFEAMLNLIEQITAARSGALARLDARGDELEAAVLALGNVELAGEMAVMRSMERALGTADVQAEMGALREAAGAFLERYEAVIPPGRQAPEMAERVEAYVAQADETAALLSQLQAMYTAAGNQKDVARGAGSRLSTITAAQNEVQFQRLDATQNRLRNMVLVGLAATVLVGGLLTFLFGRSLASSARSLLHVLRQYELGDLSARVPVSGEDEFSQLGAAFNAMASEMQGLVEGLEQRVSERTRDLTITAEIGRAVTARYEPRDLMNEIVELIRQRFGYYHAQVFLLDEAGERAELVASTGKAGRELLARRHALEVGSQSVIGQVTARGEPIVATDTDSSGVHRRNELLPDTRSEMALPMRIGEQVIGALDVQSVAPGAFDEDIVAVFQSMADQLALAIDNARLQHQLASAQAATLAAEQRLTAEAWNAYRQARQLSGPAGYEMAGDRLSPRYADAPAPLREVIERGETLRPRDANGDAYNLVVPIRVRGEVIGAFGFGGDALGELSDEDVALVEAVVERVGFALENMRLVEETARRAQHEQVLNEITAKLVGSTDVNQILQTTAKELGRVLRAPRTTVQLRREEVAGE